MDVLLPFDGLFFAKSGKKQDEATTYIKLLMEVGINLCIVSRHKLSYFVEKKLKEYFEVESLGINLKNVDSYQVPAREREKYFQPGFLIVAESFTARKKIIKTKKLCIHESDKEKWPTLYKWLIKIHTSLSNNPNESQVPVSWGQDIFFFSKKTIDVLYDNFEPLENVSSPSFIYEN